jgi:hypothetical protein
LKIKILVVGLKGLGAKKKWLAVNTSRKVTLTLTLWDSAVQCNALELVWWSEISWLLSWEFGSWKPVSSARELQWDRRQPARTSSREHGSWGMYGFESRYQITTDEDTSDWEDLVRAVVNWSVWISDSGIVTSSYDL